MNKLRILGAIAAIAVAAGLAACGGGGGGGGVSTGGGSGAGDGGGVQLPVRVESPFASANMLVPTGAASKSFAVSDCTRRIYATNTTTPINSATVVLTANGDMIFSGALGTATVAELGRINFADTNQRDIYGDAGANPYLELDYYAADGRKMYLWNNTGFESNPADESFRDDCNVGPTTVTMTLQQPLSQARVVSNIVTGSTGTVTLSSSGVSVGNYTQTGSIVSWDSGRTGTYAQFISFNLDTAQFGQGNLLNPSTHTPVAFALPAPGSTVYGYYEEYLRSNGDKTIYFTHDNINVEYRRFANPGDNSGAGRQLRFYNANRG